MFKRFLALVIVLTLPTIFHGIDKSVIHRAHDTAHAIYMGEDSKCSATAVGTHALLMATHCEEEQFQLFRLDDSGVNRQVIDIMRDGNDHSIVLTDATFTDIAEFSHRALEQGDEVFAFGNPADYTDIFRQGTYSGSGQVDGQKVLFYGLSIFSGDSGAAVFEENGNISGVLFLVDFFVNKGHEFALAVSLPIAFTPEQIKRAKDFNGQRTN